MAGRHWRNMASAMADQILLSFINFLIAVSLVRGSTKQEYALFILIQAGILMAQGIQNALLLSPQATIYPTRVESERKIIKETAAAGQIGVALIIAAVGAVVIFVHQYVAHEHGLVVLPMAFSAAALGAMSREGVRAYRYVQGDSKQAFFGDLQYAMLLVPTIALLWFTGKISAASVLLSMGAAGFMPLMLSSRKPRWQKFDIATWLAFWKLGRWSLPSVIATWINLNAYAYIVMAVLGAAAVADMSASRLFLVPIALSLIAWSNMMRPRISGMMAIGDIQGVRRLTYRYATAGELALIFYLAIVVIFYGELERVLGAKYHGLLPLVCMWAVFFAFNILRSVFMATLMASASGYRMLHHMSWFILAMVIPCLLLLSARGMEWVIAILCVVELLSAIVVSRAAHVLWKRGESHAGS